MNIGKLRDDQQVYGLYRDCVAESIGVAKKLGVNLPDSILDDVMEISGNTTADSKSSLLVDVENKRKNEIETLNGTLVRLAKENEIDVPINRAIYCAIKLV